jgi:hypothetical protein
MITIFLWIANAVAIRCIDYSCQMIPSSQLERYIAIGLLEVILEVRGFIKIYRYKDDKEEED